MSIEPCTCVPVPLHSSRQDEEGCILVDGIDDEGNRHHGYQLVDKGPTWLTVVVPSAAMVARQEAARAEYMAARAIADAARARKDELRGKAQAKTLTPQETQELLAMIAGN